MTGAASPSGRDDGGVPAPFACSLTLVAVRAPDFALGDLRVQLRDAALTLRHVGKSANLLASDVIELQDDWIGLAAIHARVLQEVIPEMPHVPRDVPSVPLSLRRTSTLVPTPIHASLARFAISLESIAPPLVLAERSDRERRLAATAPFRVRRTVHRKQPLSPSAHFPARKQKKAPGVMPEAFCRGAPRGI